MAKTANKPAVSRASRAPAAPALPSWPADAVERRPIEDLIPYARNARLHSDAQIAQIAAAIREWGWTIPVLVDESGGLIAGHGRVLAARQLEIATVPTMVARGWSDAKVRAYRVADNKLAELSSWDAELLGLEFAELRELGAAVELTGFDAASIEDLIAGPKPPEQFAGYDETIETEHECPRCGYKWSGIASSARETSEDAAA